MFKLWMERFVLCDPNWAKMEPHCLGKPTDPGRSGSDDRLFVEAVLRMVRTGSPGATSQCFSAEWNTVSSDTAIGSKPTFSSGFSTTPPNCRRQPFYLSIPKVA